MSKKTPETSTPVIEPVAPDAVPHTPVPGRRSRMNPRVFERVLKALAQDGVTLDALLKQDGMPARSSFYRWLDKHPAQWTRLARAREIGDDLSLDQARAIADASTPGTVQQDRLRVDARVRIAQVRRNRPAAAQQNVMVNLGHANTVDELAPGQGWRRKPRDQ